MDLIIVRHSDAEDFLQKNGSTDFDRELTEIGKVKMKKMAETMKNLCANENYSKIKIVSSSSTRTMQTAQIINKFFDLAEFFSDDNLYSCDYYKYLPQLLESYSDTDCLILVGHNPNVHFMLYSLCGSSVVFSKGSFASVRLDANGLTGRLMYFIEENVVEKKTGLLSLNPSILDIKTKVATLLDEYNFQLSIFMEDPSQIEAVHKIRVCLRKILSLYDFVKSDIEESSFLNSQDEISDIIKSFSNIRNLDQFIYYTKIQLPHSQFILIATAIRNEYAKALAMELKNTNIIEIESIINSIQFHADDSKIKFVNAYIADELSIIRLKIKKASPKKLHRLHKIRLECKKIKNISEIFPESINKKNQKTVENIFALVSNLGDINDFFICLKILKSIKKENKSNFDFDSSITIEFDNLKKYFKTALKSKISKLKLKKI